MRAWERTLIEVALDVVKSISERCDDELKRRFRARARSLIADLYTSGAAYVVTITAARSSAKAVEEGLRVGEVSELVKPSAKELGLRGAEEASYALYGASLLYALRAVNLISSSDLSGVIRELLGNKMANRVAVLAATWLKRFAEAYIYE